MERNTNDQVDQMSIVRRLDYRLDERIFSYLHEVSDREAISGAVVFETQGDNQNE